jgi:polysaccharide chain length determinant protein (PEP-CTERM system associated)
VDTDLDERIAENQSRLEELQLRFTDLHPDVIAVKDVLEQLEAQREQQIQELQSGDVTTVASDNPVFHNIQIELTNVNVEIEALLQQELSQRDEINELEDLVDVLPQVEAELMQLTRDYDVKQAQYESLLQRLDVAELSESAEQSDEVQFRIIDPPLYPAEPSDPNRPLLLVAVLIVGLGAGFGVSFLGNQVKPVFQDSVTLRQVTGLPLLGSVAVMRSKERRVGRYRQLGTFGTAAIALCVLFVVVFVMQEPASEMLRELLGQGT